MASSKNNAVYAAVAPDFSEEEEDYPVAEAEAIGMQLVEVQAPCDLAEGYQLSVEIRGKKTVVAVPEGGVRKGQNFHGTIVSQENVRAGRQDSSPVGAWRDGVCDCCIRGPCHASYCLSCWCSYLALGQVMTRMRLSWSADPAGYRPGGLSPFKIMVILTIFYFLVYMFVSAVSNPYTTVQYGEMPPPMPGWVPLLIGFRILVGLGIALYVLIMRIRTRTYIRNKYAIPEMYCSGCDDCCMSFFCGCCTTAQMLRHTADYDTNNAECCSETGLSQQEESPWV